MRYRERAGWLWLLESVAYGDAAGAVVVDDTVVVLARADLPVQLVSAADGRLQDAWGRGLFASPHGIDRAGGLLLCADDRAHVVLALGPGGDEAWRLGDGSASDTGYDGSTPPDQRTIRRAAGPFNRPTHAVQDGAGRVFVSDGYGNSRVHRFGAGRAHELSWGGPGDGDGEFHVPHSVTLSEDGSVLVCDRENDRVQVFSPDGVLLAVWRDVARPSDAAVLGGGLVAVAEMGWRDGELDFVGRPRPAVVAPSITVRDAGGEVVARITGGDDGGPLLAPHGVAVAADGTIYVTELLGTVIGRPDASLSGGTVRRFDPVGA